MISHFSCFLPLTAWSYPQLNSWYILLRTSSFLECLQFIHSINKEMCIVPGGDTEKKTRSLCLKVTHLPTQLVQQCEVKNSALLICFCAIWLTKVKGLSSCQIPCFHQLLGGIFDIRFPLVMRPSLRDTILAWFPTLLLPMALLLYIYNRPCPGNISPRF